MSISAPHGTFSKMGHIIGHKTNLNRYKNIELIPHILSDYELGLFFNSNNNNNNHQQKAHIHMEAEQLYSTIT